MTTEHPRDRAEANNPARKNMQDEAALLLALAAKVEAYVPANHYDLDRGRERELNEAIGLACGVGHRRKVGDPALGNDRWVPMPLKPYVTSIDSAMSLVPSGFMCRVQSWPDGVNTALLEKDAGDFGAIDARHTETFAASPALALCAAALRARAAQLNLNDGEG